MIFNVKKIASVLASAVMVGSTVGLAAAANYPSPFVKNGVADVAIVSGVTASADIAAVVSINADLSETLAEQVADNGGSSTDTVITGESYPLFTSGDPLFLNSTLSSVRQTLTDSDLPELLAETEFSGNVEAEVTHTIKLNPHPRVTFAKQPTSDDDPVVGIALGTSASTSPVYNISLTFDQSVNFTHSDSEGEEIMLMGQEFTVATETDNDELVLFRASETVDLSTASPSSEVTIEGETYTIELVTASDTSATVRVTDSSGNAATKEINEDASKKVNGLDIAVKRADESEAISSQSAELIVGAQKIVLQDGAQVKEGSDETSIDGTLVKFITTTYTGNITRIEISVAAEDSDVDAITSNMSFIDPVFASFKVDFTGLSVDDEDKELLELSASGNDKFNLKVAGYGNDVKALTFINNESTAVLADSDRGDNIRIREMAAVNETQYMVLGNEDEGRLIEITDITNTTDAVTYNGDSITYRDFYTGESYEKKASSEGVITGITIGGKQYTAYYSGTGDNVEAQTVRFDFGETAGAQVALFPTFETDNEALVMLYEPVTVSISDYDGVGTDVTSFVIPDGDGYSSAITASNNEFGNITINGVVLGNGTPSTAVTVGKLSFNFTLVGSGSNQTTVYLRDVAGLNIVNPAVVFIEGEDENNEYHALISKFSFGGSSSAPVGVSDIETTWGGDSTFDELQLESNDDLYHSMDYWGTLIETDRTDSDQYTAKIWYPEEQVEAMVYVSEVDAIISSGGSTTVNIANVLDSEVASVSSKNLVVVGGSCVNTVAATLLGSTSPVCGEMFTTKTGVASGQYLIQTFASPWSASKVATLVAGYNVGDTTNAATFLTEGTGVDTTVGKKYVGTTSTTATLQTTTN